MSGAASSAAEAVDGAWSTMGGYVSGFDRAFDLVAHGGVLDLLYRVATGQDLQAPRTWQLGNATINRLLWRVHELDPALAPPKASLDRAVRGRGTPKGRAGERLGRCRTWDGTSGVS